MDMSNLRGARLGARAWLGVAVGFALLAGLVTWLVWPKSPQPRARQFLELTACLVTGEHGVAGGDAAQVWAGLDDASKATRVQTEFMEVEGEPTMENARAYVNGLAIGHCDVLFAVGAAQVSAVE